MELSRIICYYENTPLTSVMRSSVTENIRNSLFFLTSLPVFLKGTFERMQRSVQQGKVFFALDESAVAQIRSEKQRVRIRRILTDVQDYLQTEYPVRITLQDAAGREGISTWYLSKLFRKYYGIGFCDMISLIRIGHAMELLVLTDRRLQDIGAETGYDDIGQFVRIFRRRTGLTPRQYRDQNKRRYRNDLSGS